MAKRRWYKKGRPGKKRASRKYGGQPSPAALHKEFKKLYPGSPCPFSFFIVPILHKSKATFTVQEQRTQVKEALLSGKYVRSLGHVVPKRWTLIFFVRRSPKGTLALPELRLMSKLDPILKRYIWVRVRA